MRNGTISSYGYRVHTFSGKKVFEHVLIVEKALGRYLRGTEQVHHMDKVRSNNTPSNLVICPDAEYHKLLHIRKAAFDACGNADYRRCRHCNQYDDKANMRTVSKNQPTVFIHSVCQKERSAAQYRSRKGALNG